MITFTSILMGGGIVQGQQSPNPVQLTLTDSFNTQTYSVNTSTFTFQTNRNKAAMYVNGNNSAIVEYAVLFNNAIPIDTISVDSNNVIAKVFLTDSLETYVVEVHFSNILNSDSIFDFGLRDVEDIPIQLNVYYDYGVGWNLIETYICDYYLGCGTFNFPYPNDTYTYYEMDLTNYNISCVPISLKFEVIGSSTTQYFRYADEQTILSNGQISYQHPLEVIKNYNYNSFRVFIATNVIDVQGTTEFSDGSVGIVFYTYDNPVVDFDIVPETACPGETVCVEWNTNNYFWQGITDNEIMFWNGNPHFPNTPWCAHYDHIGTYPIDVTWENECGTDSKTKNITISYFPDFTFTTECVGNPTQFDATLGCTNVDPNDFTYFWDFGDGQTGYGQSIQHQYNNPGQYIVTLTITDIYGDSETISYTVTVNSLPTVDAELEYYNNCLSNSIKGWINNPDPTLIYTWSIPQGTGTVIPATGTMTGITWNPNQLTNPTIVTVTATDPNTNCSTTMEIEFFQCCENPNTTINWTDEVISSSGTYTTSDYIMINGEVTFDADQDFTGTNIWFGPMAKINISPGVNVSYINCALSAGCNYMWQGIELPDNSTSIEVSGSKVLDAINFVTSIKGGYYNIHNHNTMRNNNCVLAVYGAPLGFSGVFTDNSITSNSMLPPYSGKAPHCGVYAEKSGSIVIGPGNDFSRLANGIWAEGSQIIVKDNTFKNIHTTQLFQVTKAAIYINNGFSDINTPLLISYVGGANSADGNLFQKCLNGVVAEHQQQLQVENNEFKSIQNYGVKYSWFHQFSTMLIANNSFTNTAVGVYAYLNLKMPSYIESNTFTWNGNPLTATAIQVLGTKYKWEEFYITNNTISKAKTGISINTANNCYIQNNTIENLRNNIGPFKSYGIRMVNCFIPQISSNIITPSNFNPNQPAASSNFNTGIQIENCWAPTVTCNTIRKVGTALHVSGVNTASTIWDNDFIKSYRGISVTNGGSLGIQGSINRPSDNQWINSSTASGSGQCVDDGTAIQSVLYVRTNPYSYNPTIQGNYYKIYCSNTLPIFGCPVAIIDDPSPLKFSITNELPQQSTESKGWNKKGLSKIIRQHPNWATNDTILSEFIDSMTLKPAVLFDSVLTKREEGLIIEALAINNSIIPELAMDDIEIEVNNYYLTLESGQSISAYENRIREIAEMCPFTEGEGVYKARILMEMFDPFNTVYFNECEDERAGKSMEFAQNIEPDFNVTVFPNPATDAITIEIQSVESNFELIVYDHTGKEVLKTELYDLISMIDLKQLEVGFYSYIIISSSGQVSTGKFSILAH